MDYLFEQLGDEKFQTLCQSIIASKFPNVQCFPVGQPDGGRDILVRNFLQHKNDNIVFQVKYVRAGEHMQDPHKWLISTMQSEIPKIKDLIIKNASKYVLLTNVKGTAHPDVGAIDLLDELLKDHFDIPALCWWRDDLIAHLNSLPFIKWSFPEILTGTDILSSLIFDQQKESRSKREQVIRAYLSDQYENEKLVKFKQIELQNDLLDLFVDIPIREKGQQNNWHPVHADEEFEYVKSGPQTVRRIRKNEDACKKLLSEIAPINILLEGGPGQGKSTVTQYISQVNRIRLLEKKADFNKIQVEIRELPIKMPFRIDLRDFALWIEGENPYATVINPAYFQKSHNQTFETFFEAHIFFHSKIEGFQIADFFAVAKESAVLLIFDGFDEIARISTRHQIVDILVKALKRIAENASSVNSIITTRPAALTLSIDFPRDFVKFELADIPKKKIYEYLNKWIIARKLEQRNADLLTKIVNEKIDLPHLRELSKNPMQLSILLSLLNARGESLPNKRTTLYDQYIDLVMTREAEKDHVIQEKRDLIIELHEYLAWLLHSDAEINFSNGVIQADVLQNKITAYLENEGHMPSLKENNIDLVSLFNVMRERVCALVSRVQGTFEFEVQPLREYFCARHLYNTAQHSQVGREMPGTLDVRFKAIARSPFWNNVVRFLAGCFGKGEIPMLIYELQQLNKSRDLLQSNQPKTLTGRLLTDWVFNQYPLLMDNVVQALVENVVGGNLVVRLLYGNENELIRLPKECGGEILTAACISKLSEFPHFEFALELVTIINANPFNVAKHWESHIQKISTTKLDHWIYYGSALGLFELSNKSVFNSFLTEPSSSSALMAYALTRKSNYVVIDENSDLKASVLNYFLVADIDLDDLPASHALKQLASILHLETHKVFAEWSKQKIVIEASLNEAIFNVRNHSFSDDINVRPAVNITDEIDSSFHKMSLRLEDVLNENVSTFIKSPVLYDRLIETLRLEYGENLAIQNIAIASAALNTNMPLDGFENLYDRSVSLFKRTRQARLKSGNLKYWEALLNKNIDPVFTLTMLLTWGTQPCISKLIKIINIKIIDLPVKEVDKIIKSLTTLSPLNYFSKKDYAIFETELEWNNLSPEVIYLLSIRFNTTIDVLLFRKTYLVVDKIRSSKILAECIETKVDQFATDTRNTKLYEEIKVYYKKLNETKSLLKPTIFVRKKVKFNKVSVLNVLMDRMIVPRHLVSLAEKYYTESKVSQLEKVGTIAEREKWFIKSNQWQSPKK